MKGKTRKTLKKILIVVLGLGLSIALLPGALAEREAPVISLSSGEGQKLQDSMTERQAAAGYIARVMTGMKSRGTVAGDQLTGPEAKLYAAARERIALVAAGRTGDTEFRIPLADIYDQLEYTAEELGVDRIFDIEGDTADFNEEALSAFSAATAVDFDRVTQSLLFDCPYDLYWFDKTAGYSYSTGYITGSFGAERKDDTIGFAVAEDDCATYSLCVSAGYSVSGAAGTFAFDTSYGTRAAAAAANARQAVSANAGKGDAEKLAAYKEYICDAVDYNDEAAYDGATPYGDPWQLVYVFDGDSSTKVVCEGYSKAFQFLCDESSFSGGVSAISVSGTMSGGTGAGNHMWNIVTMGGLHYLADITNSDDGSVGYQGDLFLKGYTEKISETAYVYRAGGTDITYEYDEGTVTLLGSTGRLAVASEEDRSEVAVSCGGYIGQDVTVTVSGLEQSRRYLEIFWLGEDGSQSESVLWDESVKDTETYMGFAFLRPGNYEVRLQAIQGDYPDPESDPLAATAAFTLQSRTLPTATVTLSANPAAVGDELTYTVSGAEAVADHIWMADARTGEELWGSNPPWSSCTAGSTGTLNYGNEPGVLHGEIWGRFDGVWSDPVEIQVEIESEGDQEELQVTPDYNILLNIKDASFTLSVENPDRVVAQLWNQENEWEIILNAENPGTSVSFAEAELPEDFTEGLFRFCAQKDGRWTAWSSGWHVFVTTKLPFCSWNGMDEATCYPDTAPLNEPENDVLQQEPFVTQYWLNAHETYRNLLEGDPIFNWTVEGNARFRFEPHTDWGQPAINVYLEQAPADAEVDLIHLSASWGRLTWAQEYKVIFAAPTNGLPAGVETSFGEELVIKGGEEVYGADLIWFSDGWENPEDNGSYRVDTGYLTVEGEEHDWNSVRWDEDREMAVKTISSPGRYTGVLTIVTGRLSWRHEFPLKVTDENGKLPDEPEEDGTMQEADYVPQGTVWKLPESLKRIESKAFANLPVTEIDIPESVTEIAKDAFDGSSLIAIYTHGNQVAIDFALSHGYIPLVP